MAKINPPPPPKFFLVPPKLINYFMHYYSIQMLVEPVQLNKETILKFPSNIYSYYDRIEILKKNVQNNQIQINDSLHKTTIYVDANDDSIKAKINQFTLEMNDDSKCNKSCKDNYLDMIKQLNDYNIAINDEITRDTSSILLILQTSYTYHPSYQM
jgi:hypothetical protein